MTPSNNPSYQNNDADPDPRVSPELCLAFYHVLRCAATDKPYAALLGELRRLYTAAGEPIPSLLRASPGPQTYVLLDDGYTVIPAGGQP